MSHPLVRPFAGLRPAPERAAEVAAPSYDVLNIDEARALATTNPWSFLHILKPEIDLPPETNPYSDAVYAHGAKNLACIVDEGILTRDPEPRYYVYRLVMGAHGQTGIVGAGSIAVYQANRIRCHEFTTPLKENDRVRQIDALNAQTWPVMVTNRRDATLTAVIDRGTGRPLTHAVTGERDVDHTFWAVDRTDKIDAVSTAFDAMHAIYIADGHHRSATAARVAAAWRTADPTPRGDQAYDYFLIVSFPDDEMQILDYSCVSQTSTALGSKRSWTGTETCSL